MFLSMIRRRIRMCLGIGTAIPRQPRDSLPRGCHLILKVESFLNLFF